MVMRYWAVILLFLPWLVGQSRPAVAVLRSAPLRSAKPLLFTASAASPLDLSLPTLAELTQAATLIVRGRVSAVRSFWSADHTLIESAATITVVYSLSDNTAGTLVVHTVGGYLADEGLGLISPHEAAFVPGEEVLLFLTPAADGWQTVAGAAGKFRIYAEVAFNEDLRLSQPLAELVPAVAKLGNGLVRAAQTPVAWPQADLSQSAPPVSGAAVARKWATPHARVDFYININTDQAGGENGDLIDFRNALIAAAASWSAVVDTDFTLAYAGATNARQTGFNGVNEVIFMPKGNQERAAAAQAWYTADQTIVEADIWINDSYAWDATGTPAPNEVDLQSALLHEFGHWLILGHSSEVEAVMFARLTAGDLKRTLQPPDITGIRAIYPQ